MDQANSPPAAIHHAEGAVPQQVAQVTQQQVPQVGHILVRFKF